MYCAILIDNKMADLGFFASQDVSSSEEEEESDKEEERETKDANEGGDDTEKLPSPDTLFTNVGKPNFLKTASQFSWDKHVKILEQPSEEQPNIHSTDRHVAIPPPPESIQSGGDGGIRGQKNARGPVRYDKEANKMSSSIETGLGMKRQRDKDTSAHVDTGTSKHSRTVPNKTT